MRNTIRSWCSKPKFYQTEMTPIPQQLAKLSAAIVLMVSISTCAWGQGSVLDSQTLLVPTDFDGGVAYASNTSETDTKDSTTNGYSNHCSNTGVGSAFIPNPNYQSSYNPDAEIGVYTDKSCIAMQRPLIEGWRGMYRSGEIPTAKTFLGITNPIAPHFLLFGDYRTALAYNDFGDNDNVRWAHRLNLDFDLKITSTERFHLFWGPLDEDGRFSRIEANNGNIDAIEEFDDDFDTAFFEGDLGYIVGGVTDRWAPFDLPFVAGKFPLLFQNGTWMLDVVEGFAFTRQARNSPRFDISNYDITYFFVFDDVDSPAFRGDDNAADMYGFHGFFEMLNGYVEFGYAFLNDKSGQNLSYHNVGLSYSRRYRHRYSTAFRMILNMGQSEAAVGGQRADGALFLWETALITHQPNYFIPYANFFVGFDNPQSAARAPGTDVLLNTGINFESDGLTGYPTLDATANNTYGTAVGVNLLGPAWTWQVVAEFAMVQTFGQKQTRAIDDDQYGVGLRYQMPINNAWILRMDGMYGFNENAGDISGARTELRWKF